MLRITATATDTGVRLRLEGKLLAPWVAELLKACPNAGAAETLELDLHDLTFADAEGTAALLDLIHGGASLVACSSFIAELLDGAQHV